MDQAIPVFKICRFLSLLLLLGLGSASAQAAQPYKIYVVNEYGAWDIVCDRYAVKKGDHIWEILRRKGRIAEENFPQFVEILKEMNPHIQDVDKIYPGQVIVIPLKQIPPGDRSTSPGGEPRYVTIPMIPDVLFDYHTVEPGDYVSRIVTRYLGVSWHEIPDDYFKTFSRLNPDIQDLDLIYPGQTVRIPELLVARTPVGPSVKKTVSEPSTVEPGKGTEATRTVVDASPLKESVSDAAPASQEVSPTGPVEGTALQPSETEGLKRRMAGAPNGTLEGVGKPKWSDTLSIVAEEMGGRLLSSGYCYFPGEDGTDLALDLSRFPVIEFPGGRHLLFQTGLALPRQLAQAIGKAWPRLSVLEAGRETTDRVVLDRLFRELLGGEVQQSIAVPKLQNGIQVILGGDWVFLSPPEKAPDPVYYAVTLIEEEGETTSGNVIDYLSGQGIRVVDLLADHDPPPGERTAGNRRRLPAEVMIENSGPEAFVSALTDVMGYQYEPQVPISFDYAGFQVETTANIIYGKRGTDLVVDFGTFYGDAEASIEKGGLKVLSVAANDPRLSVARDLMDALGCSYTESPELFAADRELTRTTALVVPGVLVSPGGDKRGLLTEQALPLEIVGFLDEEGIETWRIGGLSSREETATEKGLGMEHRRFSLR